tara:strand:- start:689 stop:955 length:267 start_codon:yes stop_codon:yes gene_type:complete
MVNEMNEVEYTGNRVTYGCGTVLYIDTVHPFSFSECEKCGETYPNIVSSENRRHELGLCVGVKEIATEKTEPVIKGGDAGMINGDDEE